MSPAFARVMAPAVGAQVPNGGVLPEFCEATWPAEPYDDLGEYWPDDYAAPCDEAVAFRALVRCERRNGEESVEVLYVCAYHGHAGAGDMPLAYLP